MLKAWNPEKRVNVLIIRRSPLWGVLKPEVSIGRWLIYYNFSRTLTEHSVEFAYHVGLGYVGFEAWQMEQTLA